MLYTDYDEAANDFRACIPPRTGGRRGRREARAAPQAAAGDAPTKTAERRRDQDLRYDESAGHPDGRPPERDCAKILLDLKHGARKSGVRVAREWKQLKKLVRRYQPDKYRGDEKWTARKFKEGKEIITSKNWHC